MRQMHPQVVKEAQLYDEHIDLPMWFSTLSIDENSTDFHDQKKAEAQNLIA